MNEPNNPVCGSCCFLLRKYEQNNKFHHECGYTFKPTSPECAACKHYLKFNIKIK